MYLAAEAANLRRNRKLRFQLANRCAATRRWRPDICRLVFQPHRERGWSLQSERKLPDSSNKAPLALREEAMEATARHFSEQGGVMPDQDSEEWEAEYRRQ